MFALWLFVQVVTLFANGFDPVTNTWQGLSAPIATAFAHPGTIVSYANQPVALTPITSSAHSVGATVFNLSNNHCAVLLHANAPKTYFTALAPHATNDSTSYDNQSYLSYSSTTLAPILAEHPPVVVASVPSAATQAACAALATSITTPRR
jgi:hypothetical protein